MRVGTFVLAAQFPGQGQAEALHRAIRRPRRRRPRGWTRSGWPSTTSCRTGCARRRSPWPRCCSAAPGGSASAPRSACCRPRTRWRSASRPRCCTWPPAAASPSAWAAAGPGWTWRSSAPAWPPTSTASPSRSICCCAGCASPRWARRARATPSARCRWCRGRTSWSRHGAGPPVVVACTSPGTVRLAAERGLPMLLGMHCGDEDKAAMVALWRRDRAGGRAPPRRGAPRPGTSRPAWPRSPTPARTRSRRCSRRCPAGSSRAWPPTARSTAGRAAMRDPHAYTELLCGLHPVGPPRLCADRLAATAERTGITRFALLVEGSGDLDGDPGERRPAGRRRTPGTGLITAHGPSREHAPLCRHRRPTSGAARGADGQQSRNSGDWLSTCDRTEVNRP